LDVLHISTNNKHKNNRPLEEIENRSIICQIKSGPSSRAMAEASFDFRWPVARFCQIRRIATPTCENHNQFCVASPLISRCDTC
jgi:hypothetical protein